MDNAAEKAALKVCDSEPIRTPDRVQPHGCLCVFDREFTELQHVSANSESFFGETPESVLGRSISDLASRATIHNIRNALNLKTITTQREFLSNVQILSSEFLGTVHATEQHVLVELTKADISDHRQAPGLQRLRWLVSTWDEDLSLQETFQQMTTDLRAVTGFDRVMAIRFRPDGSGEVFAEEAVADIDSFLGLRFPNQDIPNNARQICLEQPIRIIGDLQAEDIDILSLAGCSNPIDMTLCDLRGTSPAHVQYLKNMGINASLVVPIVQDDRLWGLFSCHNRTSRAFNSEEVTSYELAGLILNLHVKALLKREQSRRSKRFEGMTRRLFIRHHPQTQESIIPTDWQEFSQHVMKEFSADGVHLKIENESFVAGLQPNSTNLDYFQNTLNEATATDIFTNERLLETSPPYRADPVAGMMLIELNTSPSTQLMFFRAQENTKIKWLGSPKKTIQADGKQPRLLPRSSFETFMEQNKKCSRHWEPEDISNALALQHSLSSAIELHFERRESEKRTQMIVQELNHRVKNLLFLSQAIVRQSAITQETALHLADVLEDRLLAIAKAHDLLNENNQLALSIQKTIADELGPYAPEKFSTTGPNAFLKNENATLFVLAFHEIATNSLKHGALGRRNGHVSIKWRVVNDTLHVQWHETGVPNVVKPVNTGFGHYLIKEVLDSQENAKGGIEFAPDGVEVNFSISGAYLARRGHEPFATPEIERELPAGFYADNFLILEDNAIAGAELKRSLELTGAETVTVTRRSREAIKALKEKTIDAAIVDVHLGEDDSRTVAEELSKRNIPFVFLTGYDSVFGWLEDYSDVPIVKKPIRFEKLFAELRAVEHSKVNNVSLKAKKILVLEDNIALQKQICAVLSKAGHNVKAATTASEAEQLLKSQAFHGMVLDVFMGPNADEKAEMSVSLLFRLRRGIRPFKQANSELRVLAISGGQEVPGGFSPLRMARDFGANDWIPKPFVDEDLLAWTETI